MKITFIGDLHGVFKSIDNVVNQVNSDVIIQCGDFGVWNNEWNKVKINSNVPVYFVRGNHEDHDTLDTFQEMTVNKLYNGHRGPNRLIKDRNFSLFNAQTYSQHKFPKSNIHLCETGSMINIDGMKILFIGGALSIDKIYRTVGQSWYPQETRITEEEKELIFKHLEDKPNIIVTHTCPQSLIKPFIFENDPMYYINKSEDPIALFLDEVFKIYHPEHWFFGHFHMGRHFEINNTQFHALNMCDYRFDGRFDTDFYYSLG